MTIVDDANKIQADALAYLDTLGVNFKIENRGKTVVVFPYLKEHRVVDDALKVNEVTNIEKYQKAISFVFNL